MLQALLDVVVPVFAVALVGYLYAGRRGFPITEATDLIIYVAGACLVFDSLAKAPELDLSALRVPVAAAALALGGVALAGAARRLLAPLRALSFGAVALPVAFVNAGNLGLPLARLALGEEGFQAMLLVFVVFSAFHNSLGVALMNGRGGIGQAARLPLVYAALAGVAANLSGVSLPRMLDVPVAMIAQLVIPLMLLALGARMRTLLPSGPLRVRVAPAPIVLLPALRIGGGLALAAALNWIMGNSGLSAQVVLLTGALPSAVMNFALVEKFGRDESEVATVSAAIMAGTLASIVVLPVVIAVVAGGA